MNAFRTAQSPFLLANLNSNYLFYQIYQPNHFQFSLLRIRTTETPFLLTRIKNRAMKIYLTSFFLLLFTFSAFSQSALSGKLTDADTGEPILFGDVVVYRNGSLVTGEQTDFDGNYIISPMDPGTYEVVFKYVGYSDIKYENILVNADKETILNASMSSGVTLMECVVVNAYKVPLVQQDNTTQGRSLTSKDVNTLPKREKSNLPKRNASEIISEMKSLSDDYSKGSIKKYKALQAEAQAQGLVTTAAVQQKQANSSVAAPILPPKKVTKPKPKALPKSGQLTAGHWHDLQNKDYWNEILVEDLNEWKNHWQLFPTEVIELELLNKSNLPLIDAQVNLYSADKKETLWTARTDNKGKVALWVKPFEEADEKIKVIAEVVHNGKAYPLSLKAKTGKIEKQFKVNIDCAVTPVIDMLFAIDVSGSMKDELSFLKSELVDVATRVEAQNPDIRVRTASVCYQSPGDAYITKASDFSEDKSMTEAFFRLQQAKGGKGGAEAVELGLSHALDLNWSENAVARFLFILLDEPPAHDSERQIKLQELSKSAAQKGIKIIPIVGSGAKRDLEFLMRSLSILTNGTYVFLTNHSGIGGDHLEPVTDSYEVFALNDLLVKIVNEGTQFETCKTIEYREENVDNQLDNSFGVKVFPNPVSDILEVSLPKADMTAKLFNLSGQLILTLVKGESQLDVSGLPAGNYFLEIANGKTVQTEIIVVIRD